MHARAWQLPSDSEKKVNYRLQMNNVHKKSQKNIDHLMEDWHCFAWGTYANSKTLMFVYDKSFPSKYAWLKWASAFPYQLSECAERTNRLKILSTGKDEVKQEKKARKCSYCSCEGHNKASCGDRKKDKRKRNQV
jgi:hypothetical protein